ncbi:Zn-ribbon domain-containing OB-fold protein [Rhodococcus opacus]|uniref:Zn-ribbon domain-containing OB-fold protein n=1 Tax=Rhodococcus opacus TaxID=37919 RepID=UPI001C45BC3E|nr:zinc ribbon domain-containing protein [Rhodococcus opacus]MBV6756175.1 OB-fold domain-containing protein [Rhodococcus opacus]
MSDIVAQTLPGEQIRITTDTATEPFWQAAKEERLVACQCADCGHFRMPPTPFCPECQSTEKNWPQLSGRATVYSYVVVHGFPGLPDITLVPIVVEFPDAGDARLVTNAVGVNPEDVQIGMELVVDFVDIADGWKLPVFRPASD